MEAHEYNEGDSHSSESDMQISRRSTLSLITGCIAMLAIGASACTSKVLEAKESRVISVPSLEVMEDHNLAAGFSRSKIVAEIDGVKSLVGSVFFLEDERAKANFISKSQHPELFVDDSQPDFDAMVSTAASTVMLVAGAYLSEEGGIEGLALEEGKMVGSETPTTAYNGILVIKEGVPSIEFLSEIPDLEAYLQEAKRQGWDLFQQTSFIRPAGVFTSSNPQQYELRFFVEGEGKKAVINLTEPMTYSEAVKLMEDLSGFQIEKAIGLDTGLVSEGYFYDATGNAYLMVDERFGKGRQYTNVFQLYSEG